MKLEGKAKWIVLISLAVFVVLIAWWFFYYMLPTDVSIVSVTYNPIQATGGQQVAVEMVIKNNLAIPQKVYYEAGIVAYQYQLSTFPIFGVVWGGKCCAGNENYDGKWVLLGPYETYTGMLYPKMPSELSQDKCHNQGSYWKGTGTYYIGAATTLACYGQTGWRVLDLQIYEIQMI